MHLYQMQLYSIYSVRIYGTEIISNGGVMVSDTYANAMTTKSSQFHASRRYVNGHSIKPRAITLTADSNV